MHSNISKAISIGLLVLLLIQHSIKVNCQSYNNLYFKQFTKSTDLPSFSCSGIYKDNYGFLWIANAYGITIYNGSEFTNIPLYSSDKDFYLGESPQNFLQIDSSRLLITSTYGLFIFHYETRKIEPLAITLEKATEERIEIIGFTKKKDNIIIKASSTIYFFDLSLQLTKSIRCINENKEVYVRNQYTGTTCFYYTTTGWLAAVNTETGAIDSLLNLPGLKSIVINGQDNQKFIISIADKIIQMDQLTKAIMGKTLMPLKKAGVDFFPRVVRKDNYGNYWIGGETNMFIYNPATDNVKELNSIVTGTTSEVINSFAISDIWIDKESVFVTSFGGGLFEYKKGFSNFRNFSVRGNGGTYSMLVHHDSLFGSNHLNGLYQFALNKKEIAHKFYPVSPDKGSILQLENLDENNIWLLFYENFEIAIYDTRKMIIRRVELEINDITRKYFNAESNYRILSRDYRPVIKKMVDSLSYISIGKSLFRITGDVKQGFTFNFIDSINSGASISCISGNGQLILGSTRGELFTLEKNKLIKKTNALNKFFLPAKSIETDTRGNIYLMTSNGIYVYDPLFRINKHLIKPDVSLLNNRIFAGKIDSNDVLWMSATGGIMAYNTRSGQLTNYPAEGLTRNSNYIAKSVTFDNGWVYFGGPDGISAINTEIEKSDTVHRSALYFDEIINSNTTLYNGLLPGSLKADNKFSYHNNSFSFSFKSVSYYQTGGIYFKYKLAGYDTLWRMVDGGKTINFLSLSPGTYKLIIQEIYPDNKPGSTISYSISIGKPFWKTAAFFILASLMIAALIVFTVIFIIRRKLEEQRTKISLQIALKNERERISQDLHDDLGSGLTSIRLLSKSILSKRESNNLFGILEDIGKISGNMIDQMSEIIWVLNNTDDTFSGLLSHMRVYVANYISKTQLGLKFNINNTVENYYITNTQRRNLLLVIKEAVHNIVKHSQATEFSITCSTAGGFLKIIVQDNGKGYKENAIGSGNGLLNIVKRIKAINGTVEFNVNNGAQIIINLPDKREPLTGINKPDEE